MEFDYIGLETLETLASALHKPDKFSAPPLSDDKFWAKTAEACGLLSEEGQELGESVHADFDSREFHLIAEQPYSTWLGDLCSTESRLAIRTLGIKGICTIASHSIDELWADDGVAYLTAVVTHSEPLGVHLEACVDFLAHHTPAIVCCSSGRGASALVAAACLLHTQRAQSVDEALAAVRAATLDESTLDISEDDMEALHHFSNSRPTRTPAAKPTPPKESKGMAKCPLLPSPVLKRGEPEPSGGSNKCARRGIGSELAEL